jgi:hypothetical protein
MDLCKYKDIFGKVGEGPHSIRLFNIAVVDVIGTIILTYFLNKYLMKNFILTFLLLIIVSILIHRLFCVKTTLTNIFFKF